MDIRMIPNYVRYFCKKCPKRLAKKILKRKYVIPITFYHQFAQYNVGDKVYVNGWDIRVAEVIRKEIWYNTWTYTRAKIPYDADLVVIKNNLEYHISIVDMDLVSRARELDDETLKRVHEEVELVLGHLLDEEQDDC